MGRTRKKANLLTSLTTRNEARQFVWRDNRPKLILDYVQPEQVVDYETNRITSTPFKQLHANSSPDLSPIQLADNDAQGDEENVPSTSQAVVKGPQEKGQSAKADCNKPSTSKCKNVHNQSIVKTPLTSKIDTNANGTVHSRQEKLAAHIRQLNANFAKDSRKFEHLRSILASTVETRSVQRNVDDNKDREIVLLESCFEYETDIINKLNELKRGVANPQLETAASGVETATSNNEVMENNSAASAREMRRTSNRESFKTQNTSSKPNPSVAETSNRQEIPKKPNRKERSPTKSAGNPRDRPQARDDCLTLRERDCPSLAKSSRTARRRNRKTKSPNKCAENPIDRSQVGDDCLTLGERDCPPVAESSRTITRRNQIKKSPAKCAENPIDRLQVGDDCLILGERDYPSVGESSRTTRRRNRKTKSPNKCAENPIDRLQVGDDCLTLGERDCPPVAESSTTTRRNRKTKSPNKCTENITDLSQARDDCLTVGERDCPVAESSIIQEEPSKRNHSPNRPTKSVQNQSVLGLERCLIVRLEDCLSSAKSFNPQEQPTEQGVKANSPLKKAKNHADLQLECSQRHDLSENQNCSSTGKSTGQTPTAKSLAAANDCFTKDIPRDKNSVLECSRTNEHYNICNGTDNTQSTQETREDGLFKKPGMPSGTTRNRGKKTTKTLLKTKKTSDDQNSMPSTSASTLDTRSNGTSLSRSGREIKPVNRLLIQYPAESLYRIPKNTKNRKKLPKVSETAKQHHTNENDAINRPTTSQTNVPVSSVVNKAIRSKKGNRTKNSLRQQLRNLSETAENNEQQHTNDAAIEPVIYTNEHSENPSSSREHENETNSLPFTLSKHQDLSADIDCNCNTCSVNIYCVKDYMRCGQIMLKPRGYKKTELLENDSLVLTVLKGTGKIIINRKIHCLKAENIHVIDKGQTYSIKNTHAKNLLKIQFVVIKI